MADWTQNEVVLIVSDYFEMLQKEFSGQPFNKSEHRRILSPKLDERSKGSIEFKHQNVSAALAEIGLPYIEGYKPRTNYETKMLPQAIESYLEEHSELFNLLLQSPLLNPESVPKVVGDVQESPPEEFIIPKKVKTPWKSRKGKRIDFIERDALNRKLGHLGEEFVVNVEKRNFLSTGRDDLAHRIDWVSQTKGDGLGFDILSFDETDESERYIEVKTTNLGKYFPFYVTINEVRCSEDVENQYELFRVFNFSKPHDYMWFADHFLPCCNWNRSSSELLSFIEIIFYPATK